MTEAKPATAPTPPPDAPLPFDPPHVEPSPPLTHPPPPTRRVWPKSYAPAPNAAFNAPVPSPAFVQVLLGLVKGSVAGSGYGMTPIKSNLTATSRSKTVFTIL